MAFVAAAVIGAAATAYAANKAAKSQKSAAKADIRFQTETRDMIRGDLAPWRDGGVKAQNALLSELGLGAAPEGYQGFQKTQDYTFGLNEGINAVQASAAARGGLYSGAAMKDLNKWGQDYGSTRRDGYLNRLAGMADTGMSAAGMNANAAQNTAAGVSNALANMGNASAARYVGIGNALNNGITNAIGAWQYQKALGQPGGLNVGRPGSLFGSNSW